MEVKFRDFTALSRWIQVRTRAVRDAVTRAQQYADALGLGEIRPVSIADAGMLAACLHPAVESDTAFVRGASAVGGTDVEFAPEDIEVSAAVDARFVVKPPS